MTQKKTFGPKHLTPQYIREIIKEIYRLILTCPTILNFILEVVHHRSYTDQSMGQGTVSVPNALSCVEL